METLERPLVDYGVATFVRPGQMSLGDCHVLCCNASGVLLAAIDGIGHGAEAAAASKAAASILKANRDEPVISILERCHEALKATRGVVLSMAAVDTKHS